MGVVHGSLRVHKVQEGVARKIEPSVSDVHQNSEVVYVTDVLALLVRYCHVIQLLPMHTLRRRRTIEASSL